MGNTMSELLRELAYHRQRAREIEDGLDLVPERAHAADTVAIGVAAYQLVADHASDFISIHSAAGIYLFASPACERMFGWRPEELIGRSAYDFFFEEDLDRIVKTHANLGDSVPGRVEYRLRRPDGTYCWVESLSQATAGADGVRQIVAITRDISERKAVEFALEKSVRDLERFAFVAAHDLREPLHTIAGFAELLAQSHAEVLGDAGMEYVGYIEESARRMNQLINGLLQFTRLGNRPLTVSEVSLDECVERALLDLTGAIRDAGAHVEVGPLPVVRGDASLLRQVIQNLVSNAIKYRQPGVAPKIAVRAVRDGAAWRIEVQDNGRGFQQKFADRIFEPFERLVPRTEVDGTGLGLATCARIIERHGGRISAESMPDVGSTFAFTLADPPSTDVDSSAAPERRVC
jgi:PAS domain S-box-containing protein